MSGPVALVRETFELSRTMEFFTERELTTQIGHIRPYWPVALLKELLDNALDAAESAGVAPVITVDLHEDALVVSDNGPGLPLATLERSLNYSIRVSDKTGYVSPSRGQQGNALKTLWAAPFVATGQGRITVETADYRRDVVVTLDRIAQQPRLECVDAGPPNVKSGTKITLHWNGVASCLRYGGTPDFYSALYGLTDFNPHVSLTASSDGETAFAFPPTAPDWQHWLPDRPTAPHWYTPDRFRALVALLLGKERDGGKARSVNEFIREFHGLSATGKAKAIADTAGLTGAMLHDLVDGDDVDMKRLTALLTALQQAARPVKPAALGLLGQDHCAANVEGYGAAPDSIDYRRALGEVDGLPYVLEVAFGVKRDGSQPRTLSVGINFSPALFQPFPALDTALNEARCTRFDPVVVVVHLTCPQVSFADRGKSKALLPPAIAADLQRLVKQATARFTQAKRQADRNDRMAARDLEALQTAHKVKPMSVKAAAYQVMESAYLKASSNGTLPANARQIMYAARPLIIELTGKASPWKKSATFTQMLLPDFMEEYPDLCASWDVVFDDRGHFAEPHTGKKIGVGTLAVRGYISQWKATLAADVGIPELKTSVSTIGPALRYRFALFVEKEGFNPLLERAQIAKRYDLALMSTKGMSTTAARALVERLSEAGVTIFVLHDFDKSGFTICHTLQTDTRRYRFKTQPKVIDLGLRLSDVRAMNLDSESVDYSGDADPRPGLMERGATAEEAAYLVTGNRDERWTGERVELNAMDSQQFLAWLESKLQALGVAKFVPDADTLKPAWQRAWCIAKLNEALAQAVKDLPDPPDPPADLESQVKARLTAQPAIGWDMALGVEVQP